MCISQNQLETIFDLELTFNSYKIIMESPLSNDEFKKHCKKAFEEFKPSIQNYLEQMRSFRQPQVEQD